MKSLVYQNDNGTVQKFASKGAGGKNHLHHNLDDDDDDADDADDDIDDDDFD